MSKQDGYSSRTAVDLERKYNFGKTFAEVYGLLSDAQRKAQEAQNAFDGLDQEQIFNLLTKNGTVQGIYRDDIGNVYINASYIKSGKLAAEYIDATNLKVDAANITGKLTIGGALPDDLAKKDEIPTNLSQLLNDTDFQDVTGVTNIVGGVVTTDFVNALGITVKAANITGTLAIGQLPENMAVKSEIPKNISQLINDAGYQNVSGVTSIVGGVVTTDYVEALGIKVAAANVTGKLVVGNLPDSAVTTTNVTSIVGGIVTTDYVNALGITVDAANIKGTLKVGTLPDTVAKKDDIPTDVDELDGSDDLAKLSNMTTIVGGIVTTDFVNALGITVDAAQVNGVLKVGQLPSEVAKKTDIPTVPTSLSAFSNEPGFQTASGVTSIVGGLITADYINALGISVNAANIKGTLAIGQLPSGTVTTSNVTSIVGGIVTTDYVNALGINVAAANITGTLAASQIDAASLSVSAAQITGLLTASQIDATELTVDAANITGTLAIGRLPSTVAKKSDLTDFVDESGVTEIVDGYVTTDYLYALGVSATYLRGETIDLDTDAGKTAGGIDITGATTSTYAIELWSKGALRLVANSGAVYIEAGDEYLTIDEVAGEGHAIVVSNTFMPYTDGVVNLGNYEYYWAEAYISQCYGSTEAASYSDRNKKNSISYDMDAYNSFFDKLQPAIYKLNNGTSGRFHVGMIAQDVEQALSDSNIPTSDFGGFIKMKDSYALRYGEFIGLLIWQVQKLKARVAALEDMQNG